jgi:hypothetical protein
MKPEEIDKEKDGVKQNKTVTEQIFDKLDEYITADALFMGISKDLSSEIRKAKRKKTDIIAIMKKSLIEQK